MIYVVLPVHDAERALAPLLRRIDRELRGAGFAYRVVVVDDASRDGTTALLEELREQYPLEALGHARRCGLAAAFRTGLGWVTARGSARDVVLRMDCGPTGAGSERADASRALGQRIAEADSQPGALARLTHRVVRATLPLAGLGGVGAVALGRRAMRLGLIQRPGQGATAPRFDASSPVR